MEILEIEKEILSFLIELMRISLTNWCRLFSWR